MEDLTHLQQGNSVLQNPPGGLKPPDQLVWAQEPASYQKSCYILELGLQTSSDRKVTHCFNSKLALSCKDSRCLEQLFLNLLLNSCLLGKHLNCANKAEKHLYGDAKLPYVMFCHYGIKERNSLS